MHTFRDNADHLWEVQIHVNAVRRCRGVLKLDLYGLVDEKFEALAAFLTDPVRLVDTLYVLCQDQAEKLGVTDEDFGRAMGGDALGQAADAFLGELIDFFPNPRARAGLKDAMQKGREVRDRMMDEAERALKAIDPDAEARRLIGSSGSSPASSDWTPDPSPSANST